jgi:hypothetical protein
MIIIKKISTSTRINHIKNLINATLADSFLHKIGYIKSIKIIQLYNRKKEEVDRFSIVRVDSEKTEQYLISSLNGKVIDDNIIVADEYIIRHWTNDRRENHTTKTLPPKSDRKAERRRRHLKMVVLCEICEIIKAKSIEILSLTKIWRSFFRFDR